MGDFIFRSEMNMLCTKENITLLISILGACAWLPVLFEYFRKPDIACKILAYEYLENGTHEECVPFENNMLKIIKGTIYVVDMVLVSNNTDFLLNSFKVYVKYESMNKELEAYVYYGLYFNNWDTNAHYEADIRNNILYCPVFKKNEKLCVQTHFIVETNKTDVEYMKFVFVNKKNKQCIKILDKRDFKCANNIFD